ncbi:MAG: polyprenyl synthetase family protein [Spirochaetes bacterium]|nr:polyprenyl synthetase family protein [Spirochaetota bacterium]
MDALAQYACSGKMLRGILGRMGADLFTWNTTGPAKMSPELVKLGAALELFQAGLLVHDDIMDQDDLRRGKPTLHKRFESAEHELAADRACAFQPTPAIAPEHAPDYRRFGESKGICAGDIFFFEAWKLLAEADPRLAASLSPRFSRELVDVCLAQIADVGFGTLEAFPGMEEILEVYAYKTARYTITLPLCAGASLGGRPDAIPALEALGAPLGIVFQLQDDYLGLFGDERELGKPIGSDIREGKKTPYVILLLPRLSEADKRRFFGIFGRKDLDIRDLEYLRGLVLTYGVEEEIRRMIGSYVEKTRIALDFFSVQVDGFSAEAFSLLRDFIDYSISRKS